MARKGITFDQVMNAATAIKARGMEPTIHAVRIELGNEGSYSTISQHLARWKSESATKVDTRELPPEAEDAGMTAITTIWNVAVRYANEEKAAMRQEHEDTKKRLSEELSEALKEIAALEEAAEQQAKALHDAQAQALTDQKKTAKLEGELAALQRAYGELLNQVKQPTAAAPKAADTKPARPSTKPAEPGKTPAAGQ